jgi:hypothetical protein
VIAYGAQKLSRSQKNYGPTKRELWAIVHFCRYWRYFLQHRQVPFIIRTDHQSLQCVAMAMVLWYHPRLISESSPVRFPAGCTKTFLSPLPLSPHQLKSYFDVWRHLPSVKIRIAQNNIARVNIAPKKTTCSSRPRGGRRHNSLLERSG